MDGKYHSQSLFYYLIGWSPPSDSCRWPGNHCAKDSPRLGELVKLVHFRPTTSTLTTGMANKCVRTTGWVSTTSHETKETDGADNLSACVYFAHSKCKGPSNLYTTGSCFVCVRCAIEYNAFARANLYASHKTHIPRGTYSFFFYPHNRPVG